MAHGVHGDGFEERTQGRGGGDTMARAGVGRRCWRRSKADQPDAESPQRRGESSRQGRRAARQRAGGERRVSQRRGRTGRPRRSFFPSKGRCPPLSWLCLARPRSPLWLRRPRPGTHRLLPRCLSSCGTPSAPSTTQPRGACAAGRQQDGLGGRVRPRGHGGGFVIRGVR